MTDHTEDGRAVETRTRVRYVETDQMAVAHHASYLVWFEIGRTDLCRQTGISYDEIERRGFLLIVAEAGCRFIAPFRYDDEVIVRTTIGEWTTRTLRFDYELRAADGSLRARGFTRHVWLDRETRRPTRVPAEIARPFERFV